MLRMSEQMPFHIFTVFALEYGKDQLGFGRRNLLANEGGGRGAAALGVDDG
jgi:hypothetical protein